MIKNRLCLIVLIFGWILDSSLKAGAVHRADSEAKASWPDSLPRIGLVLSGGGAKGLAHIPVLEALDSLGIPIYCITGTSIGSIIGSLYAAGYSGKEIRQIAFSLDWSRLLEDRIPRNKLAIQFKPFYELYPFLLDLDSTGIHFPAGLIKGYNLYKTLHHYLFPVLHIHQFDSLPIPFSCIATNLETGTMKVFQSGNLVDAVRASMSIPSVFIPWKIEDSLYVDGGLSSNMPVEEAFRMGADIVIAVDVSAPLLRRERLNNALAILDQSVSLSMVRNTMRESEKAHILIRPNVTGFGLLDFDRAQAIYDSGRVALERVKGRLENLVAQYRRDKRKPVNGGKIPQSERFPISYLRVEGNPHWQKEVYFAFQMHKKSLFTVEELEQRLDLYYGTGKFEELWMNLERVNEAGYKMTVRMRPRKERKLAVSYLYSDYDNLELLFTYFHPELWRGKFNARVSLLSGKRALFSGELFSSIFQHQSISYGFGVHYSSRPLPIYAGSLKIGEFERKKLQSRFFLRKFFKNTALIEFFTGPDQFFHYPEESRLAERKNSGWYIGSGCLLFIDQLDRQFLPSRGYSLVVKVEQLQDEWAEADLRRGELWWRLYWKSFSGVIAHMEWRGGTVFSDQSILPTLFYPGGPSDFAGAKLHQLRSPHYAYGSLGLQFHLSKKFYLDPQFQFVQTPHTWSAFSTQWIPGLSIGIKKKFPLGNLHMQVASSRYEPVRFWFSIGFPIHELEPFMD